MKVIVDRTSGLNFEMKADLDSQEVLLFGEIEDTRFFTIPKSAWVQDGHGNKLATLTVAPKRGFIQIGPPDIDIAFSDETVRLLRKTWTKSIWELNYQNRHYRVYQHFGHIKSIYCEGEQVGLYNLSEDYLDEKRHFYFEYEQEVDLKFLLCLHLIYMLDYQRSGSGTVDQGEITNLNRKWYNKDWAPRS